MKYTPSINIAQTAFNPKSYIVTQNAKGVVGNIVDSFNAGVHSFNIIGSYGTVVGGAVVGGTVVGSGGSVVGSS